MALQGVMSLSEAAFRWNLSDGSSIRKRMGDFNEFESRLSGGVWLVTEAGMHRVFGPEPALKLGQLVRVLGTTSLESCGFILAEDIWDYQVCWVNQLDICETAYPKSALVVLSETECCNILLELSRRQSEFAPFIIQFNDTMRELHLTSHIAENDWVQRSRAQRQSNRAPSQKIKNMVNLS